MEISFELRAKYLVFPHENSLQVGAARHRHRRRRDTEEDELDEELIPDDDHHLYMNISVFGEPMHLKVSTFS